MVRGKVKAIVERNGYLEGGIKEACAIAYDYVRNAATIGSSIISYGSDVRNDEFLKAVTVLILAARNLPDEVPEQWGCDSDCVYSSDPNCPGVYGINHDSKNTCPHYCTEDK